MKKKLNTLNEQISRIKTMMNFKFEDNSIDILSEQTKLRKKVYFGDYAAEGTVAELPKIIQTYDPYDGPIKITDGNPWLATQRAISLRDFLVSNIKNSLGVPFNKDMAVINETKVEGEGDDYQYVKATIKAKLRKPPKTQERYKYSILYNFYDINGTPHILVTRLGLGAPEKVKEDETYLKDYKKFLSKIPSDVGAFIVTQTMGGGDVNGPNKSETFYGIMIPIKEGTYTAKGKNQLFFDDDNKKAFLSMGQFINTYTDESTITNRQLNNQDAKQYDFTFTRGGGGNIFGDLGGGRSGKMYYENDTIGKEITLKRMESSKIGKLEGDVLDDEDEKWKTISEILYRNLFYDNFITIKKDTYSDVIQKIKDEIDKLRPDFDIIEVTAQIQGFASEDSANNKCLKGLTPDHSWGLTNPQNGPVTPDKWVTLK